MPERGLISNGRIQYFSDDMVIRFLDRVVVTDEGYDVMFKAGITVFIPMKVVKKD